MGVYPGLLEFDNDNGSLLKAWWYPSGASWRNEEWPTQVYYRLNGNIMRKHYHKQYGSKNEHPSELYFDNTGSLLEVKWLKNNKLHRESDYPAFIQYREEGCLEEVQWYNKDVLHRDNGSPAKIYYRRKTNEIWHEVWFEYGKMHRVSGPAFLIYDKNNEIRDKEYCLFDEAYTKEDWEQKPLVQEYYRGLKNKTSGNLANDVSL